MPDTPAHPDLYKIAAETAQGIGDVCGPLQYIGTDKRIKSHGIFGFDHAKATRFIYDRLVEAKESGLFKRPNRDRWLEINDPLG